MRSLGLSGMFNAKFLHQAFLSFNVSDNLMLATSNARTTKFGLSRISTYELVRANLFFYELLAATNDFLYQLLSI